MKSWLEQDRNASRRTARGALAGAAGFTLTELVIVLAIVAIFLSYALPSFASVIRSNRATAQSNALLAALHLARTEAITRRARVSVCAAQDVACTGDGAAWNDGWIVFVDRGAPGMDVGVDEIIRVWPAGAAGDRFRGDAARVSFHVDGQAEAASEWIFQPTGCRRDQQRAVRLAASGRAAAVRETCS